MQAFLLYKLAESSLSKGFLVVVNKVKGIVKLFDIVLSIPFRYISGISYKLFNGQALTFPDCRLIEKAINFEGFVFVNVTFHKH